MMNKEDKQWLLTCVGILVLGAVLWYVARRIEFAMLTDAIREGTR